MEIMIQQFCVK